MKKLVTFFCIVVFVLFVKYAGVEDLFNNIDLNEKSESIYKDILDSKKLISIKGFPENQYLKDIDFGYESQIESYAILDMDGIGRDDLVLKIRVGSELFTVVLRISSDDTVEGVMMSPRQMSNLTIDGRYISGAAYNSCVTRFDGEIEKELACLENINIEKIYYTKYYIDGEETSYLAYKTYMDKFNDVDLVVWISLSEAKKEVEHENLSRDELIELASLLISDGYKVSSTFGNEITIGDLNGDGYYDLAFVIEPIEFEGVANRRLCIAFADENGDFKMFNTYDNAIRKSDGGGMMGEPFIGLDIKYGALRIIHSGGSAWRWKDVVYFRKLNNTFILTDVEYEWYHTSQREGSLFEEYSYKDGTYQVSMYDENDKQIDLNGKSEDYLNIGLGNFDPYKRYEMSEAKNRIKALELLAVNNIEVEFYNFYNEYQYKENGKITLDLNLPKIKADYEGVDSINKYFRDKENYFYNELVILDYQRMYRTVDYNLEVVIGNFISFSAKLDGDAGGTGWGGKSGDVLNLETGISVSIFDLFKKSESETRDYIYKDIAKQISKEMKEDLLLGQASKYDFDDPFSEKAKQLLENFDEHNFYLSNEGLVIIYPKYHLTGGVFNECEFLIPYSRVLNHLVLD